MFFSVSWPRTYITRQAVLGSEAARSHDPGGSSANALEPTTARSWEISGVPASRSHALTSELQGAAIFHSLTRLEILLNRRADPVAGATYLLTDNAGLTYSFPTSGITSAANPGADSTLWKWSIDVGDITGTGLISNSSSLTLTDKTHSAAFFHDYTFLELLLTEETAPVEGATYTLSDGQSDYIFMADEITSAANAGSGSPGIWKWSINAVDLEANDWLPISPTPTWTLTGTYPAPPTLHAPAAPLTLAGTYPASSGHELEWDAGEGQTYSLSGMALARVVLAGGTIRLRHRDSLSEGWTVAAELSVAGADPQHLAAKFAATAARYWNLELSSPENRAGSLAWAWLGEWLRFPQGPEPPFVPPSLADSWKVSPHLGEGGQVLGAYPERSAGGTQLQMGSISLSWLKNSWEPVRAYLAQGGAAFLWPDDLEQEVGLVQAAGEVAPSRQITSRIGALSLRLRYIP